MITPGAHWSPTETQFIVRAPDAEALDLCLYSGDAEHRRPMARLDADHWGARVAAQAGQAYGYRTHGAYAPHAGLYFDAAKLLVDPYATALDRPFVYDGRLSQFGVDTAGLVPRAILAPPLPPVVHAPPQFVPGGLIYELNVRGFTMRHPDVPPEQRGTIAALCHPAVIAHFQRLAVAAIELMPVVAWIDERHLPPLGLRNAWGYNPVVPMALDPRLAPGGIAELRDTVAALHTAGIGVILDLVFNHSGESDVAGPTLSLRGLDARTYYARTESGAPSNVTGCGNTLNAAEPAVRAMILASLRHFVAQTGVDGFRFDLAPVLARGPDFDRNAPIFAEIAADPLLCDRIMIAEPWDIGAGGYQLGQFPDHWLEWNDRYRDDVRKLWRGDGALGALATRMTGSSDIYGAARTRTVNFIAAHDGFPLGDLVRYAHKHNTANGEDNRDGHNDNLSWNCGQEGDTDDPAIGAQRAEDIRALLATLFLSRGTIMLTAGDEFGRTQRGNNNAYAQDNAITWLDWDARDTTLEAYVAALARMRADCPALADPNLRHDISWTDLAGVPLSAGRWSDPDLAGFEMHIPTDDGQIVVRVDRTARRVGIVGPTLDIAGGAA